MRFMNCLITLPVVEMPMIKRAKIYKKYTKQLNFNRRISDMLRGSVIVRQLGTPCLMKRLLNHWRCILKHKGHSVTVKCRVIYPLVVRPQIFTFCAQTPLILRGLLSDKRKTMASRTPPGMIFVDFP